MRRFSGILWVVAALGAGLCWVVFRAVHDPPARAAPEGAGAARPEPAHGGAAVQQIRALQRELVELRHQVSGQTQRGSGEPAQADPVRARDPRTDPDARAEYVRARREAIAGVEAAFRGEATQPRWSATASSAIQTV